MTKREACRHAASEIKRETDLAYDVAANHGQMFDNVKHMQWFQEAVADELQGGTNGCQNN